MVRTLMIGALLGGALSLGPGMAQETPSVSDLSLPRSVQGILTLDWEVLYDSSAWGKRVSAELSQASKDLNTENNRIADDLVIEERQLTERRAAMTPEDFRAEAAAFDKRATGIRAAQKAKAQALQAQLEQERQAFVQAALPVLDELLVQRGAAVVLDRRVIIRGLSNIDVTNDLILLVDERLGSGTVE
ncbi:OmpH family outer membrane protein [Thioclava sp. A2]|uniref:OmpH family outer membrane protein n=1 Tax=Thioclava sp. FCG-A2 TaxID=3080562 RepID=UPI002953FBB0|nr:OmpH family outer membrane protein [Thioclava sp. A2]MDV7269864.1 OmpH family outer membrane protein [Thioclava sp. A2]